MPRSPHERSVPLVNDLGSGTLIDLVALRAGARADGARSGRSRRRPCHLLRRQAARRPAGRLYRRRKRDLIAKINSNPMKRALRVDKIRLAAIGSHAAPLSRSRPRSPNALPTIATAGAAASRDRGPARRCCPVVAARLGDDFTVEAVACASQIGSGALPLDTVPSAGLAIRPRGGKRGAGRALDHLIAALRRLPVPVIGRIENGAQILDLRCLEDEAGFTANIAVLDLGGEHGPG